MFSLSPSAFCVYYRSHILSLAYLRSLMAVYSGPNALPIVPLSIIASFPKVCNLCVVKTGAAAILPNPLLLVRAMERSAVVNIRPDVY